MYGERHEKAGTTHAPATSFNGPIAAPPTGDLLVDGSVGLGEIDFYGFSLVAGQTYTFNVYGSGADPLDDTFMYLLNNTLTTLFNFDDDGGASTGSQITYTATFTGVHVIGVEAFNPATQSGTYTLDAVQQPPTDIVGDTFLGAPSLNMSGVTYGFIETGSSAIYGPGFSEVDTFKITAEEGKYYTIEVAGGADYASDFLDLPPGELDTVIVLYDSDGNQVAFNDDINFLQGDISSALSFAATSSGTYYLDVFSYAPWTGGYSITTQSLNLADFDPLDSLRWESANNIPVGPNNTVKVYFASAGENFGETDDLGTGPLPSFGWNAWEVQQTMRAFEEYTKVLGIKYEITNIASEATFRLITTTSDQYGAYMYPQDPAYGTQQGIAAFNVDSGAWSFGTQQSLTQGGYSFNTILHELGHGHGLKHPHDNGGGGPVMLGVTGPFDSLGVYDLNQGVYTVMSYNDAWQLNPLGPSPFTVAGVDNGWTGTLSALDIAALQERYGANMNYAKGNDTYVLKDTQTAGTYYTTIWDTKGKDTIKYDGAKNARIDLTAATLNYSPTGGGVISFVDGIWGGFTIAAGVVIENATGGAGDDALLGNSAANILKGNGGNDILVGRGGGDTIDGGAGFDTASYLDSASGVNASLDDDCSSGTGDARGDSFKSIEALQGSQFNDTLQGDKNGNTLQGMGGNDKLYGAKGNDTIDGGAGDDQLWGGDGNDSVSGGTGNDKAYGEDGADTVDGGDGDDIVDGGKGNDILSGGAGADKIYGGKDNDRIDGGAGADVLTGDQGKDTFVFGIANGIDKITDFEKGQDKIDVSATDLTWGILDSNANNKLDDADLYVIVTGGHTIIDLGAADGGLAGVDTVRVELDNLKNDNFIF